jgi:CBS-domain-containing membrane protein
MTAASIMDSHPTVLKPTDVIKTAIGYIMKNRYRNLPVVDDEGHYLGSFGVSCLLRHVLPQAALMKQGLPSVSFVQETLSDLHHRVIEMEDKPVSMCMSTDAETVSPDTPLVETLLILYHARHSLPVVDPDNGKLVGVVSYWDAGEKILST